MGHVIFATSAECCPVDTAAHLSKNTHKYEVHLAAAQTGGDITSDELMEVLSVVEEG